MRKIKLLGLLFATIFMFMPNTYAGGGSIGGFPGTGYRVNFAKGGTTRFIPIRVEGETYIGSSSQHGIGGSLGYDIGTGFAPNLFVINPEYRYYFNSGTESSPFAGGFIDFGFGSNANRVGLGGIGGYQYFFNDAIAIYGAGTLGMGSVGRKFSGFGFSTTSRVTGFEFGFRAGVKYVFGN